ncbi:aldo/keto reductase [Acholeplasma vituli]|uniref:Aldo/keto reductase n=1 Tax=Paracholeplasma vituli TaxID=69473 RepID=A0ABT2PYZ4_9MOLU|nr:aldo/keto reductase [Paracholeplasma vituli]MCU0104947.1 aldo/keto reductase [Paracholeplasma vituli]
MKVINQAVVLKNGVKLPKIGLGTWQVKDGDECYHSVLAALKNGYRHIDTAEGYQNEESVGRAVRDSGLKREDVFVTSKLESHIKTYQGALDAFEKTLKALQFEYLDLFLIHAPWPWSEIGKDCSSGNVEAWKAMESLYRAGKIRAIGVSNFDPSHIENILKHCEIIPHVNQIGYFIGLDQQKTLDYCASKGIVVEAYSPLGIGYLLSNPIIGEVAKKYQVSPAQICIRYCLEKNTVPLPKSTHEARIIQNTQVDFEIKPEDMKVLEAIKGDPRRWN